jgi:hypothetical protein
LDLLVHLQSLFCALFGLEQLRLLLHELKVFFFFGNQLFVYFRSKLVIRLQKLSPFLPTFKTVFIDLLFFIKAA